MAERNAFSLAHFKGTNSNMYRNGGKLTIDPARITIRYLFKTVAELRADTLRWEILSDHAMGYKAVLLSDSTQSFECLFFKRDFNEVQKALVRIKPAGE